MPSVRSGGTQVYEAGTTSKISGMIYTEIGGACAQAKGTAKNDITISNTVDIKGKIQGNRTADITLSAWDATDMEAKSKASVTGVGGRSDAGAENKLSRTNKVDLSGSIGDAKQLTIYAGKDTSGDSHKVRMFTYGFNDDDTLGKTRDPRLSASLTDNNQVLIADGSYYDVGTPVVGIASAADKNNRDIHKQGEMRRWHWWRRSVDTADADDYNSQGSSYYTFRNQVNRVTSDSATLDRVNSYGTNGTIQRTGANMGTSEHPEISTIRRDIVILKAGRLMFTDAGANFYMPANFLQQK